ncbi:MAG: ABC transporter substrate-binding protein [Candidatus Buchananbacteria bacterium]
MLEKLSLLKKIKKEKPIITENQLLNQKTEPTTGLISQKDLDKKLVYSLNSKKIPSLKQLKYLSHVLDQKQLLTFRGLAALIIACLIFIAASFYFQNFRPIPAFGGEYTEGLIGAPQYINPILSQTNDVDSDISRLIFSGLMKFDRELNLVPDLAEKWEVSTDQKNYTFVLKDNLKWHDGEPLTIDDVIFTFQSIQDQDFKSPLLISLRGVEIEKVDDKTVKFILPEPYSAFLEIMATGILPEHLWGEISPINANLTEYNLKPVGSGPWKFKSLAKDKLGNIKSYVLIPSPDYYGKKPYLEKITFKFYPDFETGIAALKSHSTDGISFLPKEMKSSFTSQKNITYHSFDLPQYTAIFFNSKQNEILKDKNVRLALALSIDKSKILSDSLQQEGEIINGPILPLNVKLSQDKVIGFDPVKAQEVLDQNGWIKINPLDYDAFLKDQENKKAEAEKNNTAESSTTTPTTTEENLPAEQKDQNPPPFYRKNKDVILELTLTTVNQPENVKDAEIIRDFWQNIGVKVNLQILDGGKIMREIIKPRNYEILLFGIIVGANSDPYPFWHSSQVSDPGLNLAGFGNRDVDKILEDAKKTDDPDKQAELYQKFDQILAAEIPAIFLYNPTYTYALDKKIKGIDTKRITTPSDRFNNLENWYINTNRTWQGK